jgi:DNA-binding transcriptional LysR family regulator
VKVSGGFECNDGAVLHDWALAGKGLAWRSLWEVGADIKAGRLVTVLDEFAAPPVGIHAVVPQRRHLPLRVRSFIDLLKRAGATPPTGRRQPASEPLLARGRSAGSHRARVPMPRD